MKAKQFLWKLVYPLTMFFTKNSWRSKIFVNTQNKSPLSSFYELTALDNNNSQINFSGFQGKKVLITNTASYCGYTAQYHELQRLQELFNNELVILAFPSNDFNQETDSDEVIKKFCTDQFSIQFPLMKKSGVIKGKRQNPVFTWLTNNNLNGWNDIAPTWNFCKYLINESGVLTHYFGTSIPPMDKRIISAIKATTH